MTSMTDRQNFDELFSLSYEELRRLAGGILRDEGVARLTPTTLVNEAWLRLAPYPKVANTSPIHFRRIAGRAMRQILVDAARRRQAQVHGGNLLQVTFDEALSLSAQASDAREILALDAALDRLRTLAPRQADLVDMRFFGGLSCDEAAIGLGVSEATVMREWRAARAWLAVEVKRSLQGRVGLGAAPREATTNESPAGGAA